MGDEDDSLVAVERLEIVVTFLLEGGVTNGENFIEDKDIPFRADSNGKGEADLHAGRVIFEFLVHELFEFGKFDDVVIHGVDFGVAEAEHGAVQINVLAAGEFGVEADAELDERDESAIHDDRAGGWIVDARKDFKEGGFAGAVAADDTKKLAFFDVKVDTAEDLLVFIAFDAAKAIENGLFETPRALGRETEGLMEILDADSDVTRGIRGFDASADNTFRHGLLLSMRRATLDFLREKFGTATENNGADDKDDKNKSDGKKFAAETDETGGCDGFFGDEGPADVLDNLGDRVDKDDFGGERAGRSDHGDRVDDRNGVEESLGKDFPDGADVAVFNVNRAEEEGDAEGKKV